MRQLGKEYVLFRNEMIQMAKFCPNCGNQMNENAKFCMECGTKIGDIKNGGTEIKNNMIQRSQVGTASVGNIHISPVIKIETEKIKTESERQDNLEKQNAITKPETKFVTIAFILLLILIFLWYLTR